MSLVHIAFGYNMYPRWTPVGHCSLKPNLPKVSRDSVLDSILNALSLNKKYFLFNDNAFKIESKTESLDTLGRFGFKEQCPTGVHLGYMLYPKAM